MIEVESGEGIGETMAGTAEGTAAMAEVNVAGLRAPRGSNSK
jgi:hypothetical protein